MRLKVAASLSLLRVSTEVKSTVNVHILYFFVGYFKVGYNVNIQYRITAGSTIDVKGVAVLWTLISTLAEEVHHLLWLPTEHQLSTTHYSYPAEHLGHTPTSSVRSIK